MLAIATAAIHIVLATRYGFHRDELYLLEHGKHAFDGSLDHSIATPLLSWITQTVLGDSAVALRVGPALLGGGLVIVAAALCRRLGGDPWAQWIAAGVIASSPVFIYTGGVFSTNAIDQLVAAGLTLGVVTVATTTASARWWLAIGVIAGVGIANKLVTLLVASSLLIGLLTTPARKWLRTPWPYVAALIAVTFAVPDLLMGSTSLELFGRHHEARVRDVALADFGLGQLVNIHVVGLVAVACAIGRARRDLGTRIAVASWAVGGVVLLIAHGKHYQWAPWFVAVIAAGAVPIAAWLRERTAATRRALLAIAAASTIVSWAATLPVLPASMTNPLHRELVQFADWEGLVEQLALLRDRAGLPVDTPVVTDSYGTAAAVEHYGRAAMPPPVSGANSYHLWTRVLDERWRLARVAPRVLWLGYSEALRRDVCRDSVEIGTLRDGEASNRFDFPRTVYRCELRVPLAEVWERLRAFD